MSGASPVWASRISTSAAIGMIPPAFDTGVHTATLGRVAVLVVMGPWAAANRSLRPAMHLAFGIAEVELVGPHGEEVYVVRFTCGCVGVVAHGRMIRRAGGIALVCAHVAAT